MWFNQSLTHQFAFDHTVEAYTDARLRFDLSLVEAMADAADLFPGDRVYEVGAGSGQLTDSLLAFGLEVTANEPAPGMRGRLRARLADRVRIDPDTFETAAIPDGTFSAVFAANSFHWIDPAIAFEKAHRILEPGGALGLVWNFSFLQPDAQGRLNASAFASHDELMHDPGLGIDAFSEVMASGRALIAASGRFTPTWWDWRTLTRRLSLDEYANLTVSYASTAAEPPEVREALRCAIHADLGGLGLETVEITDHVYAVVARARTEP
ncbi:class I SAM-dependent methyltransferase [Conexibacter sp. DBS9H8]|uniref:class I SAM-dependent methyltransferase n=1 Tax=Conexibacter sp. DBS9H8 TaxID=2937801 RepID=UPI00200CDD9A|nr:class I SAM-dependent methyltransferase [Conexibacter sp. DBS9H8]